MLFLTRIPTIALLTCFANALALPGRLVRTYSPTTGLSRLAKLMPGSSLAAPIGELQYVVLGLGTQNYTCISGNEDDAPGTTGAIATLYNIGNKLNDDKAAKWAIPLVSGIFLSLSDEPRVLEEFLKLQGYNHVIGHHFFSNINKTNTAVFALDQLPQSPYPAAQVSKINGTDAPKFAYPGLAHEGAIQWLHLADTKSMSRGGINTVYRLETAGGTAPTTCKGMPTSFEVKYAAQYWIFGPKDASVV